MRVGKVGTQASQRNPYFFIIINDPLSLSISLWNSKIDHPNILKILAVCLEPARLALVFEFLELGSLEDVLYGKNRNSAKLSAEPNKRIALQVAGAMSFLHGRSPPVIYGGLKPSNILLDSGLNSKLADFNISRYSGFWPSLANSSNPIVHSPFSSDASTRQFAMVNPTESPTISSGAAQYVSFDAVEGEKSDAFSFGMLLVELFSENKPWGAEANPAMIESNIMHGIRPEIPADFDPELKSLIEECWSFNPDNRPSFARIRETLDSI